MAGSPRPASAEWLARLLEAEREAIARHLEGRHRALLADLAAASDEARSSGAARPEADAGQPELSVPGSLPGASGEQQPQQSHPAAITAAPPPQRSCSGQSPDEVPTPLSRSDSYHRVSTPLRQMMKSLGAKSHTVHINKPFTFRVVTSHSFEGAVLTVIVLNLLSMAAQVQYQSFGIGYALEFREHSKQPQDTWVLADPLFNALDIVFGTFYICELCLKIHALRWSWTKDLWNWFDATIAVLWLLERLLQDLVALPASPTLLRAVRLLKLLRLVRVIKSMQRLDSLYLLMTTMAGSLKILGWSCVLLLTVQTMIAIVIFFYLKETYFLEDYPVEERRDVFQYFGSFSRAMLTMFELTLANWTPACRLMVENVSEWFMVFFLAHKLTIGFAVIGVINGVFMQETFKVASTDDSIMMRQREQEVSTYTQKMRRLFEAADTHREGAIDAQAFVDVMSDPQILHWLASMDLPVRDPGHLFELLDVEGEGVLTAETMSRGALRLRGQAKSIDLMALKRQVDSIQRSLSLQRDADAKVLA